MQLTSETTSLASNISLQDCFNLSDICADGTVRFICFLRKQALSSTSADISPADIKLIQEINRLYFSISKEQKAEAYQNSSYGQPTAEPTKSMEPNPVQVADQFNAKTVDDVTERVLSQFKKDGKLTFTAKEFDEAFEGIHTWNGERRFHPEDQPKWKEMTASSRARAKAVEMIVFRKQKNDWFIIF